MESAEVLAEFNKEILIHLFVPEEGYFERHFEPFADIITAIESYVNFIIEFKDAILNIPIAGITPPDFTIELWGAEVTVVNWDVIAPYLSTVQAMVIGICYFYFIFWLLKRLSVVIYE